MATINEKMTAIADAIRDKTGRTGKLSLDTMANEINNITGLDFDVVGGTDSPVDPKENTVWVKTDTAVNGWALSSQEPSQKESGMVWITTGTASGVEFNLLKDNCIMIYPSSTAKQYINNAWVEKEVSFYQNGQWNDLIVYLFKNGNQCTALTGGWSDTHNYSNEWSYDGNYQASPEFGGGVAIGDAMNIAMMSQTNLRCGVAAAGTRNKINLTPYNKIRAVCSLSVASTTTVRLAINDTLKTPQRNFVAAATIPAGDSITELDISNISGSYHIILGGMNEISESLHGARLIVSAVIIE